MSDLEATFLKRIQNAEDFDDLELILKDIAFHEHALGFDDKIFLLENFFEDPEVVGNYMQELLNYAKDCLRYTILKDDRISTLLSEELDMFDKDNVTIHDLYDKGMGSFYHFIENDPELKELVTHEREIYNSAMPALLKALENRLTTL